MKQRRPALLTALSAAFKGSMLRAALEGTALRAVAFTGSLLLAVSCGGGNTQAPEFGPLMRPGANCLRCHVEGSGQSSPSGRAAPPFTAAGTVFPSAQAAENEGLAGVTVRLKALDGGTITLTTNEVGNFYTQVPLDPETRPELERNGRVLKMSRQLPPLAACNACHSLPPVGEAPGRIYAP